MFNDSDIKYNWNIIMFKNIIKIFFFLNACLTILLEFVKPILPPYCLQPFVTIFLYGPGFVAVTQ